jgi:HPt (histidine-containing phosphotransfer) domain-containing protein
MTVSVIDRELLANLIDLMEGDRELVIEVMDLFLEDAPQRIEAIVTAVDDGDPGELMRAAHSLKGSAANLGARGLSGLCANLEHRGRKGSVAGTQMICTALHREFDAVRAALVAERDRLRGEPVNAEPTVIAV